MSRSIRKSVAVFIAIWLPLFSGNVLAVSVGMQSMGGDCHVAAAQQHGHHMHDVSTAQHSQSAADNEASCHHDQQDSGCGDSGICHLACSGYLAAASIQVVETQPFAQSFAPSSTQFQSVALFLLDPPPLARA